MITQAGAAHPMALAAIHESAFAGGEVWDVGFIAAQLGQPGVFALIDDAGGMIMARVAADEAEILTLAVSPDARRSGIGRALVMEAARIAAVAKAARLVLEVSATNLAARALYQGMGFVQVGRRKRYYADGSDALILALALSPFVSIS